MFLLNIWRLKIQYWTMKEHHPIKHNIQTIFHSSNETRLYIKRSQIAQYLGMIKRLLSPADIVTYYGPNPGSMGSWSLNKCLEKNNMKPPWSATLITTPFVNPPKTFGLKYIPNLCYGRNTWPVVLGSCPRTHLDGPVVAKGSGGWGAPMLLGVTDLEGIYTYCSARIWPRVWNLVHCIQ